MKFKKIWLGLLLLLTFFMGCKSVAPYEKENFSKYSMKPDKNETNATFENKVFSVLESAGGGESQAVGGGCGCN